jgi:hypothetical protein
VGIFFQPSRKISFPRDTDLRRDAMDRIALYEHMLERFSMDDERADAKRTFAA